MKIYLTALWEALRFLKRYRLRQAEASAAIRVERALEREHQRLLVEGALGKIVELARVNNEGLNKLAESQAEIAKTLNLWLKSFQVDPSAAPLESHTRNETEEWLEEQQKLKAAGLPVDLPAEFQLAYALDKAAGLGSTTPADFDREGRDNI